MDDSATAIALAAAALALLALAGVVVVALLTRRLRLGQSAILGEAGERDLVAHAKALQETVAELESHTLEGERRFAALIADTEQGLSERLTEAEGRLDLALAFSSVIRYDAYNELSGHQSSSIALLDSQRNGVVLSSIIHRDQARLYAKRVEGGHSDLDLSPEEEQAIEEALARDTRR